MRGETDDGKRASVRAPFCSALTGSLHVYCVKERPAFNSSGTAVDIIRTFVVGVLLYFPLPDRVRRSQGEYLWAIIDGHSQVHDVRLGSDTRHRSSADTDNLLALAEESSGFQLVYRDSLT